MTYTKQARDQYNHDRSLTCARLGITEAMYNRFRRYGQKLNSIYVEQCNGDDSEATEREEQVTRDAAEAQAHKLGLHIFFQTDPRGATIYLSGEAIPENNYNSVAHCMY